MSLLNQVLQDLDERAPPGQPQPVRLSVAPAAKQCADDQDEDGPDWVRLGTGVGVVVAFIAAVWIFYAAGAPPVERKTPAQTEVVPTVTAAIVVPASAPADTDAFEGAEGVDSMQMNVAAPTVAAALPAPAPAIEHSTGRSPGTTASTTRALLVGPASPSAADQALPRKDPVAQSDVPQQVSYLPLRNTELSTVEEPAAESAPSRSQASIRVKILKPSAPRLAEQAREAIEQGELSLAEVLLQRALQLSPADQGARELIVGLMLRGDRYEAAMQQLDLGLKQHPGHVKFSLIKARLLAQLGDPAAAIHSLEKLLPSGPGQAERLQMLGALYQQQSRFAQAVDSYRSLLEMNPSLGSSWVGLAISLDGLGDNTAIQAYARALRLGGLPAAAESYARQRVSRLELNVD